MKKKYKNFIGLLCITGAMCFCVACGRDVQTSVYSQERASENMIRDTEQSGENTEQERGSGCATGNCTGRNTQ